MTGCTINRTSCQEASNKGLPSPDLLVNDPVVILADEATGNLDTRTSFEIMALFQDLNDAGKTIVFVTHEADIARCATRNIIFKDGHILRENVVIDRINAHEMLESFLLKTINIMKYNEH